MPAGKLNNPVFLRKGETRMFYKINAPPPGQTRAAAVFCFLPLFWYNLIN
jgi:hypothetical protein